MFTRRHRNIALFSVFLIVCASHPKRNQAEIVDGRLPKGISERFNTGLDKVQGTVRPQVKPLPNIIPVHPDIGKVGHEALRPIHPEVHGKISTSKPLAVNVGKIEHDAVHTIHNEVNPTVLNGHVESSVRPTPNHVVYPTRLPLTQRPILV